MSVNIDDAEFPLGFHGTPKFQKNEAKDVQSPANISTKQTVDDIEDSHSRKRIRIASAVSGDQLCEIHAEASWDITRLKEEIHLLTGAATAHQRLMIDGNEVQDGIEIARIWPDSEAKSSSIGTVSLLKVSWVATVSVAFPEIHELSGDLDVSERAGSITQLWGEEWLQCSESQQLSSVLGTPDYFVAFKMEISETWRQTRQWGQILLFTANGFPQWETYPFRCPDFALECGGEPKLLVVVSNLDDDNQHISRAGLACTDYELPTEVELSVMLVVTGNIAAVYINGKEVRRDQVGRREAHQNLDVYPNPPDAGWLATHGYEVPNTHVRIRDVFYVSFPE